MRCRQAVCKLGFVSYHLKTLRIETHKCAMMIESSSTCPALRAMSRSRWLPSSRALSLPAAIDRRLL